MASLFGRIAIKYGFYLKNEAGIRRFLCEVQLLLRHLRYQSVFVKIDGVLNQLTSTAILNFQRELNLGGKIVLNLGGEIVLSFVIRSYFLGKTCFLVLRLLKYYYYTDRTDPFVGRQMDSMI